MAASTSIRRLSLSLLLTGARPLHMPSTIGICYALGELLLLRRVHVIQVDIIQQPLLDNMPQDLLFDSLRLRGQAE